MTIHPLIVFLFIVSFIVVLYGMISFYCLYCEEHRIFVNFKNKIKRKYIYVTVELRNAVIQAYENAKEKGNNFELKEYEELYKIMKSKW